MHSPVTYFINFNVHKAEKTHRFRYIQVSVNFLKTHYKINSITPLMLVKHCIYLLIGILNILQLYSSDRLFCTLITVNNIFCKVANINTTLNEETQPSATVNESFKANTPFLCPFPAASGVFCSCSCSV